MAFDKKPATWIPSWSENGTNITVPLATFPEMTAAEADADTGDIREVLLAIMEQLWAKWYATAEASRPGNMTMHRSSNPDDETGVITKQFTLVFKTQVTSQVQKVIDEV